MSGHAIDAFLRSKMIDWMLKVFEIMGLENKTFFLSIHMMDLYIFYSQQLHEWINKDDLYLIGITVIFIAIKFEEIYKVNILTIV